MYSPESLIHFGIISCHSKWQPTPVFLPGKSHIRRKLVSYSLWGRKELDTTERLHSLTCHSKASLYTHTDDRSQSTWNHWGLCYVANAHWGMVLPLLFFFGDGGRVLPLQTLTTEIPIGKITLHPQFLPHSDRTDLEGLTEILWNGLLGFACPWF